MEITLKLHKKKVQAAQIPKHIRAAMVCYTMWPHVFESVGIITGLSSWRNIE